MAQPIHTFDEASLLEAARRATGLSDFGADEFREGLREVLEAVESDGALLEERRTALYGGVLQSLTTRLEIQDWLSRYPEISRVSLGRPLFVVGLWRTGTTLLQQLLSLDPDARAPHLWEMARPVPPPQRETRASDPRIAETEQMLAASLPPELLVAHEFKADEPAECVWLLKNSFVNFALGVTMDVPSYCEWYMQHDMTGAFSYLETQLRLLSWRCPGDHLVVKDPILTWNLPALLRAFPDACFVHLHRDPLESFPSFCSMTSIFRRHRYGRVDPHAVGRFAQRLLLDGLRRAVDARDRLDPARFVDVRYRDLIRDPVGTVNTIHRRFGYAVSERFDERMREWLREHRQHKHGEHRYALSAFGLDPAELDRLCAAYRWRFGLATARSV